jgi:hypothetical protein
MSNSPSPSSDCMREEVRMSWRSVPSALHRVVSKQTQFATRASCISSGRDREKELKKQSSSEYPRRTIDHRYR